MSSLHNVPFREHEVADYERRRYRGLDQRIVHRREVQILRKIMQQVESESPVGPSAYALDAPCGYGRFSGLLLERGFRLISSDLSAAMVRRALAKDQISPVPMGIVANLTQGLPVREGAVALVLSMRFFHHLHQPELRRKALAEFAYGSMRWVILSYYQANVLHRVQRFLRRRIKRSKTRIKMISRAEFFEEAEGAGFRVERIFALFRGIHAHHIALLRKL